MKFICVAILFIAVTAASFSKCLLILCFDLNENYIANELCVNRDNPRMHCNGHCYLDKQLNKEEKPNTPFNNTSGAKFEIQLFCIDAPGILNPDSFNFHRNYSSYQQFSMQHAEEHFFHPPSLV